MKRFLEKFTENVRRFPDRPAVEDVRRSLTYRDLERESGQVRRYLKKQGIGREDVVMILTDRGAGSVSCILGVLRAGAAFVSLESGYPAERVAFIRKDAGCALVIDQALYERIIREEEPLAGFEETALHDAAYIIYTSGSTGRPKGILHEYGNIDQEASRYMDRADPEERRIGIVAPFYFVACFQGIITYIVRAYTMCIVPRDLVRSFKRLTAFVEERKIREIFMPPSYLRLYRHPGPEIELFMTGGEPANGLYYPGGRPAIRNVYGMSEAGFAVLDMILDRAYEVAPVGRPALPSVDIHLIGDDGKRIEGPGTGELCFRNEYVRGYVNLPEKTKAAFVDGVYHTGDILRRDENGVYYLLGRNDDMFKINGNRIEPAEIERRVMEITGLGRVHAKGFQEKNRAFIVLYYLTDQARALGIYQDGRLTKDLSPLRTLLPDYMIPAYYVGLEAFPLNVNGKLDRRALLPPDKSRFQQEYVRPENDAERFFCDRYAEALGLERVGAEDDFYDIGGDSLAAMRLIEQCEEGGYSLSVSRLFEARTPRKLAETAAEARDSRNPEEAERRYRKSGAGLMPGQAFHLRMKEAAAQAVSFNLAELHRLRDDTDTARLAQALNRVMRQHPVYMTRLEKDDSGRIRQVYDESVFSPPILKDMTAEAFEAYRTRLVRPFETFGGPLYRIEIIRTPAGNYLFMDHHHLVMDGLGLRLLRDQIWACYQDPGTELPKDFYYALAGEIADDPGAEPPPLEASPALPPDLGGPDTGNRMTMQELNPLPGAPGSPEYVLAAVRAAARFSRRESATVFYAYGNRDGRLKRQSLGMYAVMLPVTVRMEDAPEEQLRSVRRQMEERSAHTQVRWIDSLGPEADLPTVMLFNDQKGTVGKSELYRLTTEDAAAPLSEGEPGSIFTFGILEGRSPSTPVLYFRYSSGYYRDESVAEFARLFEEELHSCC